MPTATAMPTAVEQRPAATQRQQQQQAIQQPPIQRLPKQHSQQQRQKQTATANSNSQLQQPSDSNSQYQQQRVFSRQRNKQERKEKEKMQEQQHATASDSKAIFISAEQRAGRTFEEVGNRTASIASRRKAQEKAILSCKFDERLTRTPVRITTKRCQSPAQKPKRCFTRGKVQKNSHQGKVDNDSQVLTSPTGNTTLQSSGACR